MSLAVAKFSFDLGGEVPDLPAGTTVHAGWFEDTVPTWREQFHAGVAFAYIDCDLYESVCTVLKGIADRVRSGSVLLFDDWYNFLNWQANSLRAASEWSKRHGSRWNAGVHRSGALRRLSGQPLSGATWLENVRLVVIAERRIRCGAQDNRGESQRCPTMPWISYRRLRAGPCRPLRVAMPGAPLSVQVSEHRAPTRSAQFVREPMSRPSQII